MLKNWLRSKILFLISSAAVFLISIHTPVISDTTLIPSGDESIIISSSKLEKLFDSGHFTEGPAVAFNGTVYFSDITFTHESGMQAGHIWAYTPQTGQTKIFRSPSGMSNGLKFDSQGRLIAAEGADFGGRRLTRTDLQTGKSEIIAGLYESKPFNSPNDITIDEKGRIYFSDPRYVGHEPINQPVMGVYRIDPDGSIHRIIIDAEKPNGVAISPNQKTLYVVCHNNGTTNESQLPEGTSVHKGRMALLAYDLSMDGAATFRKVLVDYAPQDGPDGLVVDIEGNLYVAVRDVMRPGIYVYSPEGVERAYIPTPNLPTNVAFGRGEDSKTLYITEGTSLHRIKVKKNGYHLPSK
ncbi:MAG: SMP-30/gluconolactonase/LRE family protein [Candidatus Poribacteria bacterium]|nr:SMP-30/gluconolactonase/LRE family protein [Candidatus Poribacteria bacterium]